MKWSLQPGRDRIAGSTERRSVSDMRLPHNQRQLERAVEPQREAVGRAQPARVRGSHLDLQRAAPEVRRRDAVERPGGLVEAEPGRERPALKGGAVGQLPALRVVERVRRHRVVPGDTDVRHLVGLRAGHHWRRVGQRRHLQLERGAVGTAQVVRRRQLDGDHAHVAGLGRSAEGARGRVEAEPAGQGRVVPAGGRQAERVAVRVAEDRPDAELVRVADLHALVGDAAQDGGRPVDHVEAVADRGREAAPRPGAGRRAQLVAGTHLVQREAAEAGIAEGRRLGRRPVQHGAGGVGLEADSGLRVIVHPEIAVGVRRADNQHGQALAAVYVPRLRREDEPVGHAAQGRLPDAALPGHEGELGVGVAQDAAGAAGVAGELRPAVVAPVVVRAVDQHALGERPPDEHGGEQGVVCQVDLEDVLVAELANQHGLHEAGGEHIAGDVAGQDRADAVGVEHVDAVVGVEAVDLRDGVPRHAVVALVDAHGQVGQGDPLAPGGDRVAGDVDAAAVAHGDAAVDVQEHVVPDDDGAGPVAPPVGDGGVADGHPALQAAAWGGVPERVVLHRQAEAERVARVRADQVRVGDLKVEPTDRDVELVGRRQDRQRRLGGRDPEPVDRRADCGDDGQALIYRHGLRVRAARNLNRVAVGGRCHSIRNGAVAGRHRHRTVVRVDDQGGRGADGLYCQAYDYQCQKHQEPECPCRRELWKALRVHGFLAV